MLNILDTVTGRAVDPDLNGSALNFLPRSGSANQNAVTDPGGIN